MPVYTGSKDAGTQSGSSQYPENAVATVFGRLEPLITPELLKSRFLKGISLTLKVKDLETGKPFKITDSELRDYIENAVDEAEQETGLLLMPTQVSDKLPFQKLDFEQFGYFQLPHRPIASIQSLAVRLADGSDIFTFPNEWIETANLVHGQLNLIPLAFQSITAGGQVIGSGLDMGSGTSVFFNSLWNRPWLAALFDITYTVGFKDGMMPKMVNKLIGTIVAMQVLSQIAAAYANATSTSLGIDGMSQSVGTPGPERYRMRMEELKADRALLVRKLKKAYNGGIVSGTV
jgi:hypothetical protein